MQVTERQTYGMLELLGDVGGLFDALYYLGYTIVLPITSLLMKNALLLNLFSSVNIVPSNSIKSLPKSSFSTCCKPPSYLKKLKLAYDGTVRELDLVRFVRR